MSFACGDVVENAPLSPPSSAGVRIWVSKVACDELQLATALAHQRVGQDRQRVPRSTMRATDRGASSGFVVELSAPSSLPLSTW
jgi:hypothetical protein